jgi:putative transposase
MNRAVRGTHLFRTDRDFEALAEIVSDGLNRSQHRVRILTYEVLSNHWHFGITCDRIADISTFMHWVEGKHANKWAGAHKARGRGYVYQGRFRCVPVQTSTSLIRVCRYIERNALRKNLVSLAEDWTWGSLHAQCNNRHLIPLSPWPILQPDNWVDLVNRPQTESELSDLRRCITHDHPIGDADWAQAVAPLLGLTMRPVGRPKKK